MTLSREAGPSGELAKDELRSLAADYKPECHWHGMPGRSCPSPLCPVHSERAVSAAEQNARDPMRCPACGMKGETANTLCHEGLHSPRALAFFEEHCRKTETPEQIAATVHAEFEAAVADAGAHIARVDSARSSPADGPAKVSDDEPPEPLFPELPWDDDWGSWIVRLAVNDGVATWGVTLGKTRSGDWAAQALGGLIFMSKDQAACVAWLRGRLLDALAVLLAAVPAEQVVQAMGEETKDSIRMALLQEEEQEIAELKENRNAWHQRAIQAEASYRQALARAEKAEADYRQACIDGNNNAKIAQDALARVVAATMECPKCGGWADKGTSTECTHCKGEGTVPAPSPAGAEYSKMIRRAEQAERERDEARREIERLQVAARAILREAVTTESRKVTYND